MFPVKQNSTIPYNIKTSSVSTYLLYLLQNLCIELWYLGYFGSYCQTFFCVLYRIKLKLWYKYKLQGKLRSNFACLCQYRTTKDCRQSLYHRQSNQIVNILKCLFGYSLYVWIIYLIQV